VFYLVCFAYILNKKTELENSVHIDTIIEYCFKEQCGRRFTASMYNTVEQLNKILTSLRLSPSNWLRLCGIAPFNACDSMRVSCLLYYRIIYTTVFTCCFPTVLYLPIRLSQLWNKHHCHCHCHRDCSINYFVGRHWTDCVFVRTLCCLLSTPRLHRYFADLMRTSDIKFADGRTSLSDNLGPSHSSAVVSPLPHRSAEVRSSESRQQLKTEVIKR